MRLVTTHGQVLSVDLILSLSSVVKHSRHCKEMRTSTRGCVYFGLGARIGPGLNFLPRGSCRSQAATMDAVKGPPRADVLGRAASVVSDYDVVEDSDGDSTEE